MSPQLREEAQRGFAALEDPLAALLDMLDGSQGWRGKGPSLEAWVARELKRCLQAQPCPGPARVSPAHGPQPAPSQPVQASARGSHAHLAGPLRPVEVAHGGRGLSASQEAHARPTSASLPVPLPASPCPPAPAHPQRPPTGSELQVLAAPGLPKHQPPARVRPRDSGCRLH